ncbi:hypothetical protein MEBOL_005776 [Melittangium boletus DSM 14713]|uniref:Transposase IS4-like domain-containing protein n=1 Tax=Melittangium boletus DSM 14713 TaxID=1294270 RepID=A0A250IKK8_9BACT|nr:ISAs1 family transposase [Melittangium boletus]ATB32299.1 hypothetical protein MEBOL_005776 [Melittangium boletus DSM 14713]
MTRLAITFKQIVDPRASRGKRHGLGSILSLLVQGMATGRRVLRQVEALSADLVREGTEPEGLRGPVSDTTLDRLLSQLEPEGLDKVLQQSVRTALRQGVLRQDRMAAGVVSIDGKAGESTRGQAPCEPNHTLRDEQGQEYWYPFALRAALTSSRACPVLDQMMLEGKQGEATAFPTLLGRVVEKYGEHFKYVTGDAGLTSAANAKAVREAGKHYLFAVKENFQRLYPMMWVALGTAPVQVSVRERARGEWVEREVRAVRVPETEEFPEAKQWVWVRSRREREGSLSEVETRLFVTSIPSGELSGQQLLTVVRGHWGIENGPNWTADVVLEEDTGSASLRGQAPVVLSWLRLLAYNLLALVRTHLPPKDGRPVSYARCQEVLYQGLLGLAVLPESLATLA